MTMATEAETFMRQCGEAGEKITSVLFSFPKPVAICVLPGVLASVMQVFSIPRETIIAMLDSALEDIANGE
jgi:hypothetical protein